MRSTWSHFIAAPAAVYLISLPLRFVSIRLEEKDITELENFLNSLEVTKIKMKLEKLTNIDCRNIVIFVVLSLLTKRSDAWLKRGYYKGGKKYSREGKTISWKSVMHIFYPSLPCYHTDFHVTEMGSDIICPIQYVSLYLHIRGSSAYPVYEEIYWYKCDSLDRDIDILRLGETWCFFAWIVHMETLIILMRKGEVCRQILNPVTDEGLVARKKLFNFAYKNGLFDHGFDER